jgi:alpha-L-fucosidase 2
MSVASTLKSIIAASFCFLTLDSRAEDPVQSQIDWPAFIARQDMVWDIMPDQFDCGAFLGNGMMGATIYQESDNRLRFEMGRADVTEHRRDNARLPIGGLVLTTVGKITGGSMRLDLWNAEVRGNLVTDKGGIDFRAFIHTEKMVMILDVKSTGGESAAAFAWNPAKCTDRDREVVLKDPPHPEPYLTNEDGVSACVQGRASGGEFATAYGVKDLPDMRRLHLSIADTFPGNTAAADTVATVREIMSADFDSLLRSHRGWWNGFYPKNFVSVPDARLESFYWIQWYKLASASRPDRVPVDLLGPWFRKTGWPRIWWNLNIETLYLPAYTGNRLELGESLVNFIDRKRDNFFRNGREIWKFDDCATVPHTTDYEGLRGDGDCAPDYFINPGDFTWALHNYYLHYRHTMDHTMVTDQQKHAFYPLLKGSINLYLKLLKKGEDGKLHLPVLHSPEYGDCADNNYNLSLLRWGLKTLIGLNQRYQLNDPLAGTWQQTLNDLVSYPLDENGLSVGAGMPFSRPHRHWSHMLMVHPLHLMNFDDPTNRELITKSIHHWLKTGDTTSGDGIFGWSRAAAASLCATLGEGDNALKHIHGHLADKRFVRPNTMYIEGDPVIECSIVLNRSLQDMLLQSWGDQIDVFPAVPTVWRDAVFHDLRAEGAFLVSANRRNGATEWVRVKSLAGEPCRVKAGFASTPEIRINGQVVQLQASADGVFELPLKKDDVALLSTGGQVNPVVKPLPVIEQNANPWGDSKRVQRPVVLDIGNEPMRYLENARVKLGIDLRVGGAVTHLEDKLSNSGNMINSFDWGRQIQLSYYSGPSPFIGPNGEKPMAAWAALGWNPIQAGSVGRVGSKTTELDHGKDHLRVRCIPMQWPHENLPADCLFEVTYRLIADNIIRMEARIINQRADQTQYPAGNQEMPALYTNGPWHRLVTANGDRPFSDQGITTVVGKGDGKGWPWRTFYAPERWAALVNDENRGVGLFQPDTCMMIGGFHGGDASKGAGGPADVQTGYLSPIAKRILDHNIDLTYKTDIIVGGIDEIRAHARGQNPHPLSWDFSADRLGWTYENAKDAGWPVRDGLKITYQQEPRGLMRSDVIFWQAEDAPILKIEACFRFEKPDQTYPMEVVIQPCGPVDKTDFPAWEVADPAQKAVIDKKRTDFPPAPAIVIPLEVRGDGTMQTHTMDLSGNPRYRGGMKQIHLRFPPTAGTAEVRQIELTRKP